jgi:ABC-type xylose transport system permease subunit
VRCLVGDITPDRGTSLFGGRGKPLDALLGGIVIATCSTGWG